MPGCGASGSGRPPSPDRPSFGRAARDRYPLAVGAGGVGVGECHLPPLRALLRAGFARCRGGTRAPGGGGGASCLDVGRPGLGALPVPTARPSGVRPGPATHWLLVRGVWAWGPATYTTARATRARIATGDKCPGGRDGKIRNAIAFENPTHSRSDWAKAPIAIHIRILVC